MSIIPSFFIVFVLYLTFYISYIHLYGMSKKVFFSELFGQEIKPTNKYYWQIVYAEALYRYYGLIDRNCTCFECKQKIEALSNYLKTYKYDKRRNKPSEIKNPNT